MSDDRSKGTVCITGGAGFIGSHVADAFLAEGRRVLILDNLSGGKRENVPQGAELSLKEDGPALAGGRSTPGGTARS